METTKKYLATMAEWEKQAKENAVKGISEKLIAAGLIKAGQKEIAPEKIRDAFAVAYLPELMAQDAKNSTGGAGKFADVANRALMREARELPMPIADLRCRGCSLKDITVYIDSKDYQTVDRLNRSRVSVEIKTGAGCLAQGADLPESWQALINAVETGRFIVWYPFSIDDWRAGDIDIIDNAPYFFGTYSQLFDLLEGYNGDISTWLKTCGCAVNFQNLSTSGKKMAFIEGVCEHGFNWPLFRDWGRIRTK